MKKEVEEAEDVVVTMMVGCLVDAMLKVVMVGGAVGMARKLSVMVLVSLFMDWFGFMVRSRAAVLEKMSMSMSEMNGRILKRICYTRPDLATPNTLFNIIKQLNNSSISKVDFF